MDTRRVKRSGNRPSAAEQRTTDQPVRPSSSSSSSSSHGNTDQSKSVNDTSSKVRKPRKLPPGADFTVKRLSKETASDHPSASAATPLTTHLSPTTPPSPRATPSTSRIATANTPSSDVEASDASPHSPSGSPLADKSWESVRRFVAAPASPSPPGPPSDSSDATVADPSCSHQIHPAYSDRYKELRCPSCRLDASISALETTNSMLMAHGGSNQWMEYASRMPQGWSKAAETEECRFWRGSEYNMVRNKRIRVRTRDDGSLSYPTSRKELKNLIAELERRRAEEQEWEMRNAVQSMQHASQMVLTRSQPTAAIATLKRFDSILERQNLYEVEQASSQFSRKRGREIEIANSENYPGPPDSDESCRWSLTDEQRLFINAALADGFADNDSYSAPSKRKRRRLDVSVDFHPLVYVRTDSDIDAICGPTAPWRNVTQQPMPMRASRAILRTAAEHVDPAPRRAHAVMALDKEDRQSDEQSIWKKGVRWIPTPGSERVDTSGMKHGHKELASWIAWAMYVDSFDEDPVILGAQHDAENDRLSADSNQQASDQESSLPGGHDNADNSATLFQPENGNEQASPDEDLHGIDPNENPTEREVAEAQLQIKQSMAQTNAKEAVSGARQAIFDVRQVIAETSRSSRGRESARRRRSYSPEQQRFVDQQMHAELHSQWGRETATAAGEGSRRGFRPHGGIASAFAFGSFVRDAAVGLFRRHGVQ